MAGKQERNPTGNSEVAAWTRSAGVDPFWDIVNDADYSIYIYASGSQVLTFLMPAFSIPLNARDILAGVWVLISGSGNVQARLNINGTRYNIDSQSVPGGWTWVWVGSSINPSTAAAWTSSDVNTKITEIGIAISGGSGDVFVAQIFGEVSYSTPYFGKSSCFHSGQPFSIIS